MTMIGPIFLLLAVTGALAISEERKHLFDVPGFTPHVEVSRETDTEKWGYVTVRPKAHSFWWLYRSTHADGYKNRPLIMWLQGGPGGSSTGHGNFVEIGPLDSDLQPRAHSWVQSANLLFIDNPVGAGYSYVDQLTALTTDVDEVSTDLFVFMKAFLADNPEFKTTPFYIFGQSYGGKMGSAFAQRLHKEIGDGNIDCNLKGQAMGNSWISPFDSTLTWAPLLFTMSAIDEKGYDAIMESANKCYDIAMEGRWKDSVGEWRRCQQILWQHSNYIDFYNILKYNVFGTKQYARPHHQNSTFGDKYDFILGPLASTRLYDMMNGVIREKLGVIPSYVTWDGQSNYVFSAQEGDFMKHVVDVVDDLLNNTDVQNIVYQGQVDLICDTKGAFQWIKKLKWPGMKNYHQAEWTPLADPITSQTDIFVKAYGKFKFYANLRAGHSVPADMGPASLRMFNRILQNTDK